VSELEETARRVVREEISGRQGHRRNECGVVRRGSRLGSQFRSVQGVSAVAFTALTSAGATTEAM
jgi:hypothetical protein